LGEILKVLFFKSANFNSNTVETKILSTLLYLLNHRFLLHINQITSKSRLKKDLGMNEFEQNEMLLYVENFYHIDIDNRVNTVGDIVEVVSKKADWFLLS
jgi:hypothetical protein